jgi:hypothetical protein
LTHRVIVLRAESAFRAGLHKMFDLDIERFVTFQIAVNVRFCRIWV